MYTSPSEIFLLLRCRMQELQEVWVIKTVIATIATFVATLVAPIYDLLPVLFLLMLFDFMLGVKRAYSTNSLSSAGFRKGFLKLIIYMIGIAVILLTARTFFLSFGTSFRIDIFSIGFLCVNESISCLSHLTKMGFPTPIWLNEKLAEFHKDPFSLYDRKSTKRNQEKEEDDGL